MADLPKNTLRVNGQLVETTDEETKNLAKKAGLPATPATPAGAAALGASPDAAKMAGVRNAGQAAPSTVSIDGGQSLQTVRRTAAPRQTATATEAAEATKANGLQKLGGLGDQIQALVNKQLSSLSQAPAGPQFNDAQFKTLAPSVDQNALKGVLTSYQSLTRQLAATTDPAQRSALQAQANAQLATLKNTYGIADPQSYLDMSTKTIGQDAASQVMNPDQVKVGSVDLSAMGIQPGELDGLLGSGWQNLSVGDFKQKVKDLQEAEFSKVAGLKAQLASLPPGSALAEQVRQQLADMGQVGVTGVEQGVAKLGQAVDSSDVVKVGNQEVKVEDLLKDESINRLITDYLNPAGDPTAKAALEKNQPGLVGWIKQHQEGLTALVAEMGKTEEGYTSLQASQHALANVAPNVTLSDDVMKSIVPGWGQDVSSVSDLSGNSVYQAVKSDAALASKLNAHPDQVANLSKLAPADIDAASKNSDKIAGDAALLSLLGYGSAADVPPFLTDKSQASRLARYAPIVATLRSSTGIAALADDPDFVKLIKSGDVTTDVVKKLANNPRAYDEFKAQKDLAAQISDLEKHPDPDAALRLLFGDNNVSAKSIKDLHDQLAETVRLDPSDKESKNRLGYIEQLLGSDGELSSPKETTDFITRLRKSIGSAPKLGDLVGKTVDGKADFSLRRDFAAGVNPMAPAAKSTFADTIKPFLSDGRIDIDEIDAMTASQKAQLYSMPPEWLKKNNVATQADIKTRDDAKLSKQADQQAASLIESTASSGQGPTYDAISKIASGNLTPIPLKNGYDLATFQDFKTKTQKLLQQLTSLQKSAGTDVERNTIGQYISRTQKALDALPEMRSQLIENAAKQILSSQHLPLTEGNMNHFRQYYAGLYP
jgi:hypothetical protein